MDSNSPSLMPSWTPQEYAAYQAGRSVPHPKQCERPAQLGSDNAREAQGPSCVQVCFTLYRVRLLDVDAKYASIKDLLDCIVDAGFALGDQEGEVDLQVTQVKVKTRAEERTEIQIL